MARTPKSKLDLYEPTDYQLRAALEKGKQMEEKAGNFVLCLVVIGSAVFAAFVFWMGM